MKISTPPRFAPALSCLMIFCLLFAGAAPVAFAKRKGDKNFKNGQTFERAQQWERAAQEYALAVAADPSTIEYQLHYRRALFQASQVYMQRGRDLAEKKDYVGAYNAFRQAYGFDQVNELALSEMQRMLRLQREKQGVVDESGAGAAPPKDDTGAKVVPTSYQGGAGGQQQLTDPRMERRRTINISPSGGDLKYWIQTLAEEIGLNVIFDTQSFARERKTDLSVRDVTSAQALDYIFLKERLFFQRVDRRTILVADQAQRMQYQQLGIRTFFLKNADPEKVRQSILTFIPPQPGRPPATAIVSTSTNSLTLRDTPENLKVIEKLIESIDKDRAEVVMDVRIYEVTRNDLLQFGNSVGTTLGANSGVSFLGGSGQVASQVIGGLASAAVPTALGAGLLLPPSTLTALQDKSKTRLVFQTQLHAFDNEESSADIGQKIPIQTASVPNYGFNPTNQVPQGGNAAPNTGVFGNFGYPVIQYTDVGLKLKFKPQVFPNRDVQVKMDITSSALAPGSSNSNLTPSISQRVIQGFARIPNNRTMMVANIAQDQEQNGVRGLPLVGLIPVLNRLFVTPTRNNIQSDIVLIVTPHVLRAPDITPDDQQIRPSGTMQSPTSESLAQSLQQEGVEDNQQQLAELRRNSSGGNSVAVEKTAAAAPPQQPQRPPNSVKAEVQLYNIEGTVPDYVPAPKILVDAASSAGGGDAARPTTPAATVPAAMTPAATPASTAATAPPAAVPIVAKNDSPAAAPQPVFASATNSANIVAAAPIPNAATTTTITTAPATSSAAARRPASARLAFTSDARDMYIGERRRLAVTLQTDAPLGLATLKLRFDPRFVAIKSISEGGLITHQSQAARVMQSIDARQGALLYTVSPHAESPLGGSGVLFFIEVEALVKGQGEIAFENGSARLIAADGREMPVECVRSAVTVK